MPKIGDLLAKLHGDSAKWDWLGAALVVAIGAAFLLGVPADQLHTLAELLIGGLALAGVRGASLTAKRKAALDSSLALAKAIADVKAGKGIAPELAEHAVELVAALAEADTSPIEVPHA
jgi:hypothetical protein